ncbi:biotin--[acetyl-CoA-carboxylase] ligase [bacterium]|nr:biotin--[acetyl-CoA-carboxylase] ligase [bacterium]
MIDLGKRDWFGVAGFEPGAARRRRGGFLYLLDRVGSTSDFLLSRGDRAEGRLCRWDGWGWQVGARQTLPPPTEPRPGSVVVARRQSAGRGRMGRRWHDGGGLTMSWLIDPVPARQAARLAVWTGLVATTALRDLTGVPVMLKWPNDLRLRGRKLGGIILDMVVQGPHTRFVAGLGITVGEPPADMPADVREAAAALTPDPPHWSTLSHLAGAILTLWDNELPRFLDTGWAAYRAAYRAVDDLAGREIRLQSGRESLCGEPLGIDEGGALLLRTADGATHTLLAGDVHITETSRREGDHAAR